MPPGAGVAGVVAPALAPSTTRPSRSGAASSSADLIASSSVDDDAGHAVAAALEADPRDALLDAEQLDVAAVRLHVRTDRVERLDDPLVERDRVQVVDQHQARDHAVVRQPLAELVGCRALGDRGEDPLQALAVELDHRADQLLGSPLGGRVVELLEPRGQLLDPLDELLRETERGPASAAGPPFDPFAPI